MQTVRLALIVALLGVAAVAVHSPTGGRLRLASEEGAHIAVSDPFEVRFLEQSENEAVGVQVPIEVGLQDLDE